MKFWSVKLGRPDPTLRMRQVVHGLNRVPTRETIGVLSGRLLCEKEIFLRWIVLRITRKVIMQDQLGRVLPFAFALTCYKIHLNFYDNCRNSRALID